MRERLSRTAHILVTKRKMPFIGGLASYLRSLKPGDKLLALILSVLVAGASLVSAYALTRTFLVEVPSYGGTLSEGVLGSPRFVNPLLALSDADRDLAALTYAGLMGYDKDGVLVGVLAESYAVSEDGKTYTFTLRENTKFHDGTPVTAEDVVFTVEKAQDPSLKSPELANWANIRAEAVDARTVSFTLPKAFAPFLEDATLGILPSRLWRTVSNEEFPFSPLQEEPVGAGPFKVAKVERNKTGVIEQYQIKAFDGYALGRPYLDRINFEFFAQEEDLARAYERGRVESAYGLPEPDALRVPYSRVFGVFFNANQNPLFARKEVREALSLAIDRTYVVGEVLGGYATPVTGPVPPGSGIELATATMGPEDRIEAARTALETGGWEQNAETNVWTHEEKGLTLTVTVKTSNVTELKAVANAVKSEWEKFGVPVALEFYEPGDLTTSVIRPRRFEALLFGMVVGRDHDLFAFWESSQRNDPGLNVSMYVNREVDELLGTAREAATLEEARSALTQVNTLISDEYPAAFLYAPEFVYAIPKELKGVSIPQIASPSDRFASAHAWHKHVEAVWPFLIKE